MEGGCKSGKNSISKGTMNYVLIAKGTAVVRQSKHNACKQQDEKLAHLDCQ